MPEYFDMLRMADLSRVFGSEFLQLFKDSGVLILLAILLLLASWASFVVGLLSGSRGLVAAGLFLAVLTGITGWVNSYLGYSRAAAFVSALGKVPKQSELVGGANAMAWSALVPSVACVATISVMLVLASVLAVAAKLRGADVDNKPKQ